jgi:transcriptional regulator with XRE-family HTH domain
MSQKGSHQKLPAAPQVTATGNGEIHPLRRLRHTRWITLQQLHRLTQVHYSTLSKIESGALKPTAAHRLKISRALGVDPVDLFGAAE